MLSGRIPSDWTWEETPEGVVIRDVEGKHTIAIRYTFVGPVTREELQQNVRATIEHVQNTLKGQNVRESDDEIDGEYVRRADMTVPGQGSLTYLATAHAGHVFAITFNGSNAAEDRVVRSLQFLYADLGRGRIDIQPKETEDAPATQ